MHSEMQISQASSTHPDVVSLPLKYSTTDVQNMKVNDTSRINTNPGVKVYRR